MSASHCSFGDVRRHPEVVPARIVDQHVEAPVRVDGGGDRGSAVGGRRHVERAEPDFARQVGAGRGNLGELRLVPRGGVDEATGGGEPADGSGTES